VRPFRIGVHDYGTTKAFGTGLLAALRVSTSARYAGPFTPVARLAPDAGTVLLLDFTDQPPPGDGKQARDRSTHEHHGIIEGATWVGPAAR
jgi:hypothetical protein